MKNTTLTLSGLALIFGVSLMSCKNSGENATSVDGNIEAAADHATDAASAAGGTLSNAANAVGNAASDAGNAMGDAAQNAGDAAANAANEAGGAMTDAAMNAKEAAADGVDKAGNKIVNAAKKTGSAIEGAAGKVGDKIKSATQKSDKELMDESTALKNELQEASSVINTRIKVLTEKMATSSAVEKVAMQKQLDGLKATSDRLTESLNSLNNFDDKSGKGWSKFVKKIRAFLSTLNL